MDKAREIARDRKAKEIIAFHKKQGEGSAMYRCGRFLGVLHLRVCEDAWKVQWSEELDDSLADY